MRNLRNVYCSTALTVALAVALAGTAAASERPRVYTNQQYIEDLSRPASLPLDDPKAMFAFILESIPDQVKVYPTENYYYFYFHHRGTRYAGNIRLDAKDRDEGKVHFAYFPELTEWQKEDALKYRLFGEEDGVDVVRVEQLVYRVTLGERSVLFRLNNLSRSKPPDGLRAPHERYLGPVFDESGIRFFLLFNDDLKLFHYVLDESSPVTDELFPSRYTNRILIGRRTGFAFYNEHRFNRKILIGVHEANGSVNNYFDGPFDQLPDNFIEGESLRDAILAVEPSLAGKIDRHGGSPDGASRYMVAPYIYYRNEEELLPFHECAADKALPQELYPACFVVKDDPAPSDPAEGQDAPARKGEDDAPKP